MSGLVWRCRTDVGNTFVVVTARAIHRKHKCRELPLKSNLISCEEVLMRIAQGLQASRYDISVQDQRSRCHRVYTTLSLTSRSLEGLLSLHNRHDAIYPTDKQIPKTPDLFTFPSAYNENPIKHTSAADKPEAAAVEYPIHPHPFLHSFAVAEPASHHAAAAWVAVGHSSLASRPRAQVVDHASWLSVDDGSGACSS